MSMMAGIKKSKPVPRWSGRVKICLFVRALSVMVKREQQAYLVYYNVIVLSMCCCGRGDVATLATQKCRMMSFLDGGSL